MKARRRMSILKSVEWVCLLSYFGVIKNGDFSSSFGDAGRYYMLVERGKAIHRISTAPVWPPNENLNMNPCCREKAAEIKTLKMVVNFHQADKWLMENEMYEKCTR